MKKNTILPSSGFTIFSGIQPSGDLHIGNLIGAIEQWVKLQNNDITGQSNNEMIFCIVDLHAITIPQDPKILREKILELAALYIACDLDPAKSRIFVQSENPDHANLAWILGCNLNMGELFRMTQYKEKIQKIKKKQWVGDALRDLFYGPVGLFNYPALMAADILLYDTTDVPVGEDQDQHVELTRNVAKKFNNRFGEIFKLPKIMLDKRAARIMSLQHPNSKMSKSDKDPAGTVNLLDPPDLIRKKVTRAVTDSGKEIKYKPAEKPGISNLIVIYSKMSKQSIADIEAQYTNKEYTVFKKDLADVVVQKLTPIQKKYKELRKDEAHLKKVLQEGLTFARGRSSRKISEVKKLVGLGAS